MKLFSILLIATAYVFVSTTEAEIIGHGAVVGFSQQLARTGEERSALKFKAYLHVLNGCAPFPSVDAAGNVGGGLKPTGHMSGGCSGSPGQVYVRSSWYGGRWAIMYAWYFPKDQGFVAGVGHRHDWECAVVWINNPDDPVQHIIGVSASAHGGFRKYSPAPSSSMDGTHVNIKYWANGFVTHATDTEDYYKGENPALPLIHWHQLTPAARNTLNTFNYGSANVPMNDYNFYGNLGKARL